MCLLKSFQSLSSGDGRPIVHLMHGAYADTVAYGVEKANAGVLKKSQC